MSNGKGHTTWPAVAIELLRTLGKAAPVAIVVAGLLVAGYYFYRLTTQARIEAERLNQDKLKAAQEQVDAAQKRLIDTYERFEKITSGQIESIKKLMELRDQADWRKEKRTEEIAKLREEAENLKEEASRAKREAQNFEKSKKQAEQELQLQRASLNEIQEKLRVRKDQLDKSKEDLEIAKRELKKSEDQLKDTLKKRADQIEMLLTHLMGLAEAVREEDSVKATKLANIALQEVLDPKEVFVAFAKNPGTETFKRMRVAVGRTQDELLMLARQGLGFAFWILASETEDAENALLIGVVEQDDVTYRHVVGFKIADGLAVDLEDPPMDWIFAVRLPLLDNWYKKVTALRSKGMGSGESEWWDTNLTKQPTWTFAENFFEADEIAEVVYGQQAELPILNADLYLARFPKDLKEAIAEADREDDRGVNLAMALRAKSFNASNILSLAQLPSDFRRRFEELANTAVGAHSHAKTFIDPSANPDILGHFAALVLRRDFQIVGFRKADDTKNKESELRAEFNPVETGAQTETAVIHFKTFDAPDDWRLVDLEIRSPPKALRIIELQSQE